MNMQHSALTGARAATTQAAKSGSSITFAQLADACRIAYEGAGRRAGGF